MTPPEAVPPDRVRARLVPAALVVTAVVVTAAAGHVDSITTAAERLGIEAVHFDVAAADECFASVRRQLGLESNECEEAK